MEPNFKESFTYNGAVQHGKLIAVVADQSIAADGYVVPAAANVEALGIVEDGVVPNLGADYIGGSYQNVTGQAWPTNMPNPLQTPNSPKRAVITLGKADAQITGAVTRGDRLIIGNNLGQLESVVTAGLAAGTPIWVVGFARQTDANPSGGDVIRIFVNIHHDTV
jgi:hypothetical protein